MHLPRELLLLDLEYMILSYFRQIFKVCPNFLPNTSPIIDCLHRRPVYNPYNVLRFKSWPIFCQESYRVVAAATVSTHSAGQLAVPRYWVTAQESSEKYSSQGLTQRRVLPRHSPDIIISACNHHSKRALSCPTVCCSILYYNYSMTLLVIMIIHFNGHRDGTQLAWIFKFRRTLSHN